MMLIVGISAGVGGLTIFIIIVFVVTVLIRVFCRKTPRYIEMSRLYNQKTYPCRPSADILCGCLFSYTLHCALETTLTMTFDPSCQKLAHRLHLSRKTFTQILLSLPLFVFKLEIRSPLLARDNQTDRPKNKSQIQPGRTVERPTYILLWTLHGSSSSGVDRNIIRLVVRP